MLEDMTMGSSVLDSLCGKSVLKPAAGAGLSSEEEEEDCGLGGGCTWASLAPLAAEGQVKPGRFPKAPLVLRRGLLEHFLSLDDRPLVLLTDLQYPRKPGEQSMPCWLVAVRLLKFEDLMAIRFVVDSAVWALRNRIEQTKPPSPLPRLLHVARFVEPPLCPSQLCLRCQSRSSARLNVEG
ncbi:hypothetical protein AK812_SmicGene21824 [Symbiodinium microadriaticum]|uniref:Uncharacterized protein n=1 Tax=Symbiodinium microadriaticum TaxID=2951 RepID=A0A1Q9DLG2_SYMMI|nr:hypothetical protein AK812_SmicGene21824 [Symbiodinium microadriaticum]